MTPPRGRAAVLLLAALAACGPLVPSRGAVLPSELSVLAEQRDGTPLSLLLGLRRNSRDQLDVRVAEGAQVYDGRRVWSVEVGDAGFSVADRVSGERVRFDAGAAPRLLAVYQRSVWFDTAVGVRVCGMKAGRCGPGTLPGLPLTYPGPGKGFHLALENGTLRLFLPQEVSTLGVPLATGIARLLGVYWVRGGTGEADTVVHRTFRGRARVHALARSVAPDGDLADWPGAAPLVVDAPWQLQSGADGWDGPRDGSFSVAATWTADRLCVAGRVRDDAPGPDDTLTVRVDDVAVALPLLGEASAPAPWTAVLRPTWRGGSYEACLPTSAARASDELPFAVVFTDADPGEATTVLASAPERDGLPLGELLLDAPD